MASAPSPSRPTPTPGTDPDPAVTARRPLRADARRNRQRLLDVALDAFVEQGIGASLDDIARRAGVGIGTLYRHFPTREALVEALIHDGVEELCARSDELAGSHDPLQALAHWLRALVDHTARFSGLAAAIARASAGAQAGAGVGGGGAHDDALAESCARVNAAGGALMARAREAGQLRLDVSDADIIDLAASIAWIRDHAPRDDHQVDRLLTLLLDALTPHPTRRGQASAPPDARMSP